jgi:hypothetical protein
LTSGGTLVDIADRTLYQALGRPLVLAVDTNVLVYAAATIMKVEFVKWGNSLALRVPKA